MNLIILGSGGCTPIPKPGCTCPVCEEAREEGIPYARTGPSLFLEDINALFDTPEDICQQLTRESIQTVNHIFYTHWHPDHTLGMRIVEQMNSYILEQCIGGKPPSKKTNVYALPQVMEDIKAIRNKNDSYLDFYEKMGIISSITLQEETTLRIADIEITPLLVANPIDVSTVFILKHRNKKVAYAPCDTRPFPLNDMLRNLDLLIIGDVIPEEQLKDGYIIPEGSELRKEISTMDELTEIIDTLHVARTIVVHIEEEWGKSLEEYEKIEKQYKDHNIQFAYDGMKIVI